MVNFLQNYIPYLTKLTNKKKSHFMISGVGILSNLGILVFSIVDILQI